MREKTLKLFLPLRENSKTGASHTHSAVMCPMSYTGMREQGWRKIKDEIKTLKFNKQQWDNSHSISRLEKTKHRQNIHISAIHKVTWMSSDCFLCHDLNKANEARRVLSTTVVAVQVICFDSENRPLYLIIIFTLMIIFSVNAAKHNSFVKVYHHWWESMGNQFHSFI